MVIYPKKSLYILITIVVGFIVALSISFVQMEGISSLLRFSVFIIPAFFVWAWKKICFDTKIQLRDGILFVFTARIKPHPLTPRIVFSNYKFSVNEITKIRLWHKKTIQRRYGVMGPFNDTNLGKGELTLSVTNTRGEESNISLQVFHFLEVKKFLENNFFAITVFE